MEIFEKASKNQLRFETNRGSFSTEDLWQLDLPALDIVARNVNAKLKNESEESFLPSTTKRKSSDNELRLEILKRIIEVKDNEAKEKKDRVAKRTELLQVKELMAQKKAEELASKDSDYLKKRMEELEAELV